MSWSGRVGWCPSIVTPMQAGDGLLVRVKPTAATVSTAALRAIAGASERHGSGLIDLTNRSNLQMRGLRPDAVKVFAGVVRAHGLVSAEPALEEVRNVAADPLGADDPDAAFDSHAIARAVEAMLAETTALRALPPKFGFLVDCGRLLPVSDAHADIVIRERAGILTVGPAGGSAALPCTPDEAPDLARRLVLAFLALAGPADAPPFRMRELIETVGEAAILAKAGFAATAEWAPDLIRGLSRPSTASFTAPPIVDARDKPGHDVREGGDLDPVRAAHLALMYAPAPAGSPVGYVAFPGRDRGAVVAGAPRGRVGATTLAALADLAERFADATVRMTPWRALALVPVEAAEAPALLAALADLGLIIDPTDPRRALRGPDIDPAPAPPPVRPEAIAP